MTRAVLIGVAAALVLLMLLSVSVYIELRYTGFGELMRDSSSEMRNPHVSKAYTAKYGDPIDFLSRWLRLNQMLVEPAICAVIGVLIGFLTCRVILASVIGVTPVVILNSPLVLSWPPDAWTAFSVVICTVGCWSAARGIRYRLGRRAQPLPSPA